MNRAVPDSDVSNRFLKPIEKSQDPRAGQGEIRGIGKKHNLKAFQGVARLVVDLHNDGGALFSRPGAVVWPFARPAPRAAGKCRSAASAGCGAALFGHRAQHPRPRQGLVRHDVSDPAGAAGAGKAQHRRGGSAPRKRPSLAQTGLSRRSLQQTLLAGRRADPTGHSDCHALGVRGPSRNPALSRQGFRLRRFPRIPLAVYILGPAPSHPIRLSAIPGRKPRHPTLNARTGRFRADRCRGGALRAP